MNTMCPVALKQVNERAVQINATLAIIALFLFFFTSYRWIVFLLTADFFIRGFLNASYSLFGAVSRSVLRIFKVQPIMVDAGPKIFAAKIGFIFCCIIVVLSLLNFQAASRAVGSVFVFFAALEAVFRFCVACKLYPYICKIKTGDS